MKVDALLVRKNQKRHFLRDIENSFHEVIHIGLECHQFFSFQNFLTNTVARDVQSLGRNGLWLAGCVTNDQNFFVKFVESYDEQLVKISRRYLDSCLSYSKMTKTLL